MTSAFNVESVNRRDSVQCLHFGCIWLSLKSLMKTYDKRIIAAPADGLEDEHVVEPLLASVALIAAHNKTYCLEIQLRDGS